MDQRKIVSLAVCLASFAGSVVFAQIWTGAADLGVTVKNNKGRAITGARVELEYRGPGAGDARSSLDPLGPAPRATDPQGRASFGNLGEGSWSVEVSHPNHLSFVATVILQRGKKPEIAASFLQASGSGRIPLRVKLIRGGGNHGDPIQEPVPTPQPPAARIADIEPAPEPVVETPVLPSPPTPVETKTTPPEPEVSAAPPVAAEPIQAEAVQAPEMTESPEAPDTAPEGKPESVVTEPTPTPVEIPALETPEPLEEQLPQAEEPESTPVEEPAVAIKPADPMVEPEVQPLPAPPALPEPPPAPQPELLEPAPEGLQPSLPAQQPIPAPEPELSSAPSVESIVPEPAEEVAEVERASPTIETSEKVPQTESAALLEAPSQPEQLAIPAAPPGSLRSYRSRTCFECKPGEWSVGAAAAAGGGPGMCPPDALDRAEEALELLAKRLGNTLAQHVGPILSSPRDPILSHLENADQTKIQSLVGDLSREESACRLVAVSVPKGARFSAFRYEAFEGARGGDCVAEQPCTLEQARWLANPGIERSSGATLIWAVFQNEAAQPRQVRLTGYFSPGSWTPPN